MHLKLLSTWPFPLFFNLPTFFFCSFKLLLHSFVSSFLRSKIRMHYILLAITNRKISKYKNSLRRKQGISVAKCTIKKIRYKICNELWYMSRKINNNKKKIAKKILFRHKICSKINWKKFARKAYVLVAIEKIICDILFSRNQSQPIAEQPYGLSIQNSKRIRKNSKIGRGKWEMLVIRCLYLLRDITIKIDNTKNEIICNL